MSTICDIDDCVSKCIGAKQSFTYLLQAVAKEYERIRLENLDLKAKLQEGLSETFVTGSGQFADEGAGDKTGSATQVSFEDAVVVPGDEEIPDAEHTITAGYTSQATRSLLQKKTILLAGEVQELWKHTPQTLLELATASGTYTSSFHLQGNVIRVGSSITDTSHFMQRFILKPHSPCRTLWDLMSILVLSVDIVMVPMVAFDIPETTVLQVMNVTFTTFWTLDIFATFITGYHDEGLIEMRPSKIFRNYVKSWFVCDSVIGTSFFVLGWVLALRVPIHTHPDV